MRQPRVRAPELVGRGWLNTGGRTLTLADLRGKIAVLDFWTFCCVNCLHVLDELRPLEQRFAAELVIVGVHSPKFAHEADPDALAAAVARYAVAHPVLDDPELATWRSYAVRAWPTLVVLDPEGYVVHTASGEGHGAALAGLITDLVAEHAARGTLRRGDSPYVPAPVAPGLLAFPARAVRLPDGGLLVADAGHHRLVELDPDGSTPRRVVGSGHRGLVDGTAAVAAFAEPQGLAVLPAADAARLGVDVVVADTANHALRGVRLADATVRTLAGDGSQPRPGQPHPAGGVSSPWDVAWVDGGALLALAGTHQLARWEPGALPRVVAGTIQEGLVDGEAAQAWFAQPSGLAAAGPTGVWFVDAETSALRLLTPAGVVRTAVGTGLFDFGFRDGPADQALLQHPLGLAVLPDGSVLIADTYNGAVRRYLPDADRVETVASGLAEPVDVLLDGDAAIWVVESAAHRLTRVPLPATARQVSGPALRTHRPATVLAPGPVQVTVTFDPPAGQHLDDRYGPATHLAVSATPPGVLLDGAGAGPDLHRALVLLPPGGAGGRSAAGADADLTAEPDAVLHVSARAASCDDGDAAEHPACHVHAQDWGVPVLIRPGGAVAVDLVLRG